MTTYKCKNCNHKGKQKRIYKGSLGAELVIWIVCLILALFTVGISIIIAIIYSVWRLGTSFNGCPMCQKPNMVKQIKIKN